MTITSKYELVLVGILSSAGSISWYFLNSPRSIYTAFLVFGALAVAELTTRAVGRKPPPSYPREIIRLAALCILLIALMSAIPTLTWDAALVFAVLYSFVRLIAMLSF